LGFIYVFTRSTDPGSEPVQDNAESPISVPNLGQSNGSNSTNDPDPNALVGLDALLQVLQNTDASSVVSPPSPDSFDFSRSPSQGNENAVQVAATALNQLSQQETQDGQHQFAGMILSVRSLFPQRYSLSPCNSPCARSFTVWGTRPRYPNTTFPTRRLRHSFSLITSTDPQLTGYFPSSIGQVSRVSIARSHRVKCRLLSNLSPCCLSPARQPCSSYQKLMTTCVHLHLIPNEHLYPRDDIGCPVC
jgi:hypothetical protein